MARITIEDCLHKVNNRFTLIHMAAKRVRQIRKGSEPLVLTKNKDIVVALREIAAGSVFKSLKTDTADALGVSAEEQLLPAPSQEGNLDVPVPEEKEV